MAASLELSSYLPKIRRADGAMPATPITESTLAFSIASYGAGSFATCQLTRKVLSGTIAPKRIVRSANAVRRDCQDHRDCQEFRVGAAIVDPKEVPDGTTQGTPYP